MKLTYRASDENHIFAQKKEIQVLKELDIFFAMSFLLFPRTYI